MDDILPPFRRLDSGVAAHPVILSIPHAGRDYPLAVRAASRLSPDALILLEDRHADLLAAEAARAGFATIAATRARACIDLNRHEQEIDPAMVDGDLRRAPLMRSAKTLGGLGLVPRRLKDHGDIWRYRLPLDELRARIETVHRPYHGALADLIRETRRRFGVAVLVDLHSMPPLSGAEPPNMVVGDLFGRSAAGRFALAAQAVAEASGWRVAQNTPYAGGHILSTHGAPGRGVHAVQIELDRRLYLDAALRAPGPGLARANRVILDICNALAAEAAGQGFATAAE